MKISNLKSQISKLGNGFTVLETLVAISVISLAIAGATSAVKTAISSGIAAKNQTQAFYLAQEAVEILRNKRDSNVLTSFHGGGGSWLAGIANSGDPCEQGKTCTIDAYIYDPLSNIGLSSCPSGWNSCDNLKYSSSLNMYGYDSGWSPTQFKREIQVEKNGASEIAVTVRISWSQGITSKEFKTKTILTNWF